MGSIIAGISLTCFAASYAVAWALELAKLAVQSRAQQFLMMGFVVAGWFAQTLYLGYRVVEYSASPLSSSFDWCLVAAWLLIGAFLYLSYYLPRAALGLYMLPLALALVAAATFADRTPFAPEPASRVWGAIHGVALLIGTLAVMVGFVAGVMYLVQARRLKRKLPPSPGFRLPSLEWLEKVNSRVIILSTLMVGVGFVAGIILNVVGRDQPSAIPWSDPVIWTSGLMLGWLAAAAIFNAFYRPARRGRKVAYLTVVSFVFLVVVLAVFLLVSNEHGGQNRRAEAGESRASQVVRHDYPANSGDAFDGHFGPGGGR
jgi:ABC-type transport system involved in cytochrome c biogenesis permease subunit